MFSSSIVTSSRSSFGTQLFSTSWQVSHYGWRAGRNFCTRGARSPSGGKSHFCLSHDEQIPECLTELISSSIFSAASLAPPCAGPHSEAIPAAIQANGFAPEEPAVRTVEVEAFCSWSGVQDQNTVHSTFQNRRISYGSHGVENIIFRSYRA